MEAARAILEECELVIVADNLDEEIEAREEREGRKKLGGKDSRREDHELNADASHQERHHEQIEHHPTSRSPPLERWLWNRNILYRDYGNVGACYFGPITVQLLFYWIHVFLRRFCRL